MVFSCCSAESSDSYQHLQITAVTFFYIISKITMRIKEAVSKLIKRQPLSCEIENVIFSIYFYMFNYQEVILSVFLVFRAKNKDFSCYLAIFTAYLARLWDIQSRPNSISTFSMPRSRNLLKFLLAFKLPKVCSTSAGR